MTFLRIIVLSLLLPLTSFAANTEELTCTQGADAFFHVLPTSTTGVPTFDAVLTDPALIKSLEEQLTAVGSSFSAFAKRVTLDNRGLVINTLAMDALPYGRFDKDYFLAYETFPSLSIDLIKIEDTWVLRFVDWGHGTTEQVATLAVVSLGVCSR